MNLRITYKGLHLLSDLQAEGYDWDTKTDKGISSIILHEVNMSPGISYESILDLVTGVPLKKVERVLRGLLQYDYIDIMGQEKLGARYAHETGIFDDEPIEDIADISGWRGMKKRKK